ncbi:MAG: endopeptidase La [Chloroflexota bacterium]
MADEYKTSNDDAPVVDPDAVDEQPDDNNNDPDAEIGPEDMPVQEAVNQILQLGVNLGTEADEDDDEEREIPDELPILPLRGLVVYPQTAIPLTVGQPRSIKLVDDIMAGDRLVGLVASRDPEMETPEPEDIHQVGTLASIHRLFRAPDGTIRLLVQGMERIKITEYTETEPYLKAKVEEYPELTETNEIEEEAAVRNVTDLFEKLADLVPNIPGELISSMLNMEEPLHLVYSIATYMRIDLDDAQELLELTDLDDKLRRLIGLLTKEVEVLELGRKIQTEAKSEMEKMQRDYFLREQMKAIQRELGENDDQTAEVEGFREKIEAAGMPEEPKREALREVERLSKLPVQAAEYGVIRTYLDWMVNMPWSQMTDDNLDIKHARDVLNEDHHGLEDIKDRILEYLAVRKLRHDRAEEFAKHDEEHGTRDYIRRERGGAILLFVGPPGVGKTSLGASIARAMGRKFIRMSLGGIRDEAEIRGFRRTYIGAMPGRIVQTIRRAETRNPLIMLDEVDKISRDLRGDPSSALLEVLDPEQNSEFRDNYLDVPFDLSDVLFIATANELDPIPGPLRDRMEIIQLSGYTQQEKIEIAKGYLVPRQIRENGLRDDEIEFTEEAIRKIIQDYTREAGVRTLEREIGRAARKVVTQIAAGDADKVVIDEDMARELLGKKRSGYQTELEERTDAPGVATGLAWTPVGGEVLYVEATAFPGSKGFRYTGQLGDVMKESAQLALSLVRAHHDDLGVDSSFFDENDIHLHVPAGAVPKDGPSAGITMTTALASLLTGRSVRHDVAMTGEITLSGKVLPVGGIKDKVLAAHRLGVKTVILPQKNEPDIEDIPEEVREQLTFVLVDELEEVLDNALVS